MTFLPPGDAAALIVSVALWLGFGQLVEHSRWSSASLTAAVNAQRVTWMRRAMERDFRIMDATLLGNLMHSISFLASASLIILGVIGAALGAVSQDYGVAAHTIPFLSPMSVDQIEVKLVLIAVIFVYSFLNFTWSLQQFNFCCILLGGAPRETLPEPERHAFADRAAKLTALGGRSFNRGLRGFYFALAGVGWFVHPLALVVATLAVVLILARREFFSRTRHVLRD